MAARLESAVTIARPVEEVYRFLLNLDQHPTDPGVESVVKTPDGPTAEGTAFHFHHGGRPRQTTMRFTSLEAYRSIHFDGHVGPLRPAGDFSFQPTDSATKLTVSVAANPIGPFRLLTPLINRKGQEIWDQRLARIKAALEAPA
jgi:carbon monoxide dehydrogenase subunit G